MTEAFNVVQMLLQVAFQKLLFTKDGIAVLPHELIPQILDESGWIGPVFGLSRRVIYRKCSSKKGTMVDHVNHIWDQGHPK